MIKKINNTERFIEELREKGLITILNKPEHIAAILDLNKQMGRVRRDYRYKNAKSIESAKQTYLS